MAENDITMSRLKNDLNLLNDIVLNLFFLSLFFFLNYGIIEEWSLEIICSRLLRDCKINVHEIRCIKRFRNFVCI